MSEAAAQLSGHFEADEHILPLRVYYEDTDAAGIVYYANYLRFAERARTELLRHVSVKQSDLARERGLAFAVTDCRIRYRAPAKLDDMLQVRSRLTALGAATLETEQAIVCGDRPIVDMEVRVACLRRDGRPARIPKDLRAALAPYCRSREGEVEVWSKRLSIA